MLIIVALGFCNTNANAQLVVAEGSDLIAEGWTLDSLIRTHLLGYGLDSVWNITFNGSSTAMCSRIAHYRHPSSAELASGRTLPSTFPFTSGVVLCTGHPSNFKGPNLQMNMTTNRDELCSPYAYDANFFANIAGVDTIPETAVLEFDCVPRSPVLRFRYIFASEEYPAENTRFNDVFGVFLRPIGGSDSNVTYVPNTNSPVSINTINQNVNSQYYVAEQCYDPLELRELSEYNIGFDGRTVPLESVVNVNPCKPYHFRIAIANVGSSHNESAVFFEANSLRVDTIFTTDSVSICANELPIFTWQNRHYTGPASDSAHLMSFCEIDSIVTFHLGVRDTTFLEFSPTACDNYTWASRVYDLSGDYTTRHIGANRNYCDSVVTMHLTVNYTTHDTIWDTCSQNQLPRHFRDRSFVTDQHNLLFVLPGASSHGCDSIIHYNLKIFPNVVTRIDSTICRNQLPITWRGYFFSDAGTRRDTLHTTRGADSIVIYTLHVNENSTSIINEWVIENNLPRVFNNVSFYNDTTGAIITIPNRRGCDSIITYSLTVYRNVSNTVDSTICRPRLPFTWNGHRFTNAGTATVTLRGNHGVDSVLTMNLHVNDTSMGHIYVGECYNYTWFGTRYTTSGNQYHRFPNGNAQGCDSTVVMHLTIFQTTRQTVRDTIVENALPHTFNGRTFTGPVSGQTITLTGANVHGCDSVITYYLTVLLNKAVTVPRTICENELPYTWNVTGPTPHDLIFTAAGSQSETLLASDGTDSVVTYLLHVNPNTHSQVTEFIVENQLPYTYHDSIFTTDATHETVIFPNRNGCDSIVDYSLVVYRNVYETVDSIICRPSLPFTWNGHTFADAGTTTVTLVGNHGVDSILTMNLFVNDTSMGHENVGECYEYTWNGTRYTTSGDKYHLIPNGNYHGCDSTAVLHLTIFQKTYETVRDTIVQNDLPHPFNGRTYYDSILNDTIILTGANIHGCDSVITYYLTVLRNKTTLVPRTICENDLPYSWHIDGPTPHDLIFASAGLQSETLEASDHTDSVVTYQLTVNLNTYSLLTEFVVENALPHTYHDSTFTTDATHETVIFPNHNGCDSIVDYSLVVYRNVFDTIDSVICNNHLPITWNGQTFNGDDTLQATLVGNHNVDSNITMRVHVVYTSAGDTTVQNCYNYSWYGMTYSASGNYNHVLVDGNAVGCDSTVTLHLTIYDTSHHTVHENVIENSLPYVFNGHYYDTVVSGDTIWMSNADIHGCDSIIHFSLIVHWNKHTELYDTICENFLPHSWPHLHQSAPIHDTLVFDAAGLQYDTLSAYTGADSIIGYHLFVDTNTHSSVLQYILENDIPTYTYHGHAFEGDTNTTIIISNNRGCDSIINFTLRIRRNVYDTIDSVVCNNHLPLVWNDSVFAVAGNKTANLRGRGFMGVDSIVTMFVTIVDTTIADTVVSVCDSMPWYGNYYAASGRYPHTFIGTNAVGCDSTLYLNLTIRHSNESLYYDSVIENNLPRLFNHHSYSSPITDDTLCLRGVNAVGCDSVIHYNLVVWYNDSTFLDTAVCENFIPLVDWHHNTFTQAGTQYDTLYTIHGADSVLHLNLRVKYNTDTTIHRYIIENDLPYTFNGHTYVGDTIGDTVLISNHLGCDSTIIFTLSIYRNVFDTLDSTLCENYLPLTWNTRTFTTDDTMSYCFIGGGMFGVDSTVTMRVHVLRNTYSTYYDTVIENNLPRLFNGTYFSDSISHATVTITNSAGCDSIIDYSLFVWRNVRTDLDSTVCQNFMPVVWEDSTFVPNSPVPTVPYTLSKMRPLYTIHGADSLVYTHLLINPNTVASIYDTIVQNTLPYIWENTTFVWGGPRVQVMTTANANGCDSIVTLNLHVWENVWATADSTICENSLTFSWNDSLFYQTDTKVTKIFTTHGADSTLTMNVTVHYNTASIVFDTTVENSLTYTYNGYPFDGPVQDSVIIFPNANQCDSIVDYSLHVWWNIRDTVTYTTCENNVPITINGITFTRTGAGTIILPSYTGADSIVWTHVTVNPNTHGTQRDTLVENNLPASYYGHTFYTDVVDTTVYIPGFNHWGCDSSISYNLKVWRNVSVVNDTTICQHNLPFIWNDSVFSSQGVKNTQLLTTHGADSIVTMRVFVNPDNQYTEVVRACDSYTWPNNGREYTSDNFTDTVMLKNRYGCDSLVTLNLYMHSTIYAEQRYDTVCIDALPYPYEDTIFMPGTQSGDFTFTYTSVNLCDSVIPYHLYVMPLPLIDVHKVGFVCDQWAYEFIVERTDDIDSVTWTSRPDDRTLESQAHLDTVFVAPKEETTYTVTGTNERFQCTNSMTFNVQEVPTLQARIRHNPPYATPDQLEFEFFDISTGQISQRLWTLPDLVTSDAYFRYTYPTQYDSILVTLMVEEDRFHCQDTVSEWIPYKGGIIWAPDVFTPRMGENNRFQVKMYNVVDYAIYIYTREGALVYSSTNMNDSWDGHHKGKLCPQAAYTYRVVYTTVDAPNTPKSKIGTVTLLH